MGYNFITLSVDIYDTVEADIDLNDLIRQLKHLDKEGLVKLRDGLADAFQSHEIANADRRGGHSLLDEVMADRLRNLSRRLSLEDIDEIEKKYG